MKFIINEKEIKELVYLERLDQHLSTSRAKGLNSKKAAKLNHLREKLL